MSMIENTAYISEATEVADRCFTHCDMLVTSLSLRDDTWLCCKGFHPFFTYSLMILHYQLMTFSSFRSYMSAPYCSGRHLWQQNVIQSTWYMGKIFCTLYTPLINWVFKLSWYKNLAFWSHTSNIVHIPTYILRKDKLKKRKKRRRRGGASATFETQMICPKGYFSQSAAEWKNIPTLYTHLINSLFNFSSKGHSRQLFI
jgi:hypothetical protein